MDVGIIRPHIVTVHSTYGLLTRQILINIVTYPNVFTNVTNIRIGMDVPTTFFELCIIVKSNGPQVPVAKYNILSTKPKNLCKT